MVFKIQRPLSTNAETPMALIYGKNRSECSFIPWTKVRKYFNDDELKIYVKGRFDGSDLIVLRKLTPRDW